jgi:hypothetical protein
VVVIKPLEEQVAKNRDKYRLLRKLAKIVPDRWYLAGRYRLRFGTWPNIDNPSSFNEHMLHMILNRDQGELRSRIADKLAMRDYVAEKAGAKYLTRVYQRAKAFDDFDWNALPQRFVLKSNHASRQFLLVDKATADRGRLREVCDGWLRENYAYVSREYVYADIEPELYAEEIMERRDGGLPNDVKAHVFNGKLRFYRMNENKLGKGYHEVFYDRNWKRLPFLTASYEFDEDELRTKVLHEWPKPEHLDEMTDVAERLGEPFKFIRVDFCDLGDRFVVTELTNFPAGGNDDYQPRRFDEVLGRLLEPKDDLSEQEARELDRLFP